jgi:hypothetical protein
MIARLKRFFARLGGSLWRRDHASESNQPVENTDAVSIGDYSFPPNYVPPADEGRPRH